MEVFRAGRGDGSLEGISREVWGIRWQYQDTTEVVVDESDDHVYMDGG